jgi:hypothetical protein
VLTNGTKKARVLAESVKTLKAAVVLNGDELGAVLTSLGPDGAERDRLSAVVALLANKEGDGGRPMRGAFAGLTPHVTGEAKVTSTFTSALHGCLREQSVNAGSPATTRSV